MSLVLGLEITPRTVRGAFLKTALRGFEMERYAEVPIPQASEDQSTTGMLRSAVAQLTAQGSRPPDRVIASLDGEFASLRIVDLPLGVEKKIAEVLPGELEALLPFEVDEAIVDYQIVGRDETSLQLMTVATPASNVAERLRFLHAAGIEPRELAVGAAVFGGLEGLLAETLDNRTVLVIDVGAKSTDFAVLSSGQCTFARTLSGGMDLVESGRRDQLGASLQRTLASYRAQRAEEPTIIWLSGETSTMESARQWLTDQLGIDCGSVPVPTAPGADDETAPKFAKAAALAGRALSRKKQLDLRQREFASKAAAGQIRKHIRLIAVCAAAILLSFIVSLGARYRVAKAEQERLMTRLAEVSEDLLGEETRSALHARELLTGGPRIDDPLPRFDAYDVLEAISESIPTDIVHDTRRLLIEIDDDGERGRFEIQGTLGTIAERDRLVEELQNHRCFSNVEKGSISTAVGDRKDYKVAVRVQCEDRATDEEEED
jgi:Tfp pilus assembly PilM family ATPase